MSVETKEIYGSRPATQPFGNGNGDKAGETTAELLEKLANQLRTTPRPPTELTTPYVNTIPPEQQPKYPGDREIERRIKSLMRWNAMAMVVKANSTTNVGGHISTYASAATLYEVAFNHFFRGATENFPGDLV
ncbi:MAG TPA: hypothetical protein VNU95_16115, partial [Candidatus Acidoferrales bacterium]|nr:hypothetical protein [Candidatus Acidoferrales bacterium]